MNIDGFYAVDFSALTKGAHGVVIVENGQVRGGDDQYLYSGQVYGTDDALNVMLKVKAYVAGAVDVFGQPSQMFSLNLTGVKVGNDIHLNGTDAGHAIQVKATGLTPINF